MIDLPEPSICIVGVTNRLSQETERSVGDAVREFGESETVRVVLRGASNVATARNVAYTAVHDDLEREGWKPSAVIVSIDDDMSFQPQSLADLVKHVRRNARPASGVYPTAEGKLHGTNTRGVEWECGLGFCAFSVAHLQDLAARLPLLAMGDSRVRPFCCDGQHPTLPSSWTPEDWWFSRELGGFDLLPIPVGHLKTFPIWPDAETLRRIAEHEPLPKTTERKPVSLNSPSGGSLQ